MMSISDIPKYLKVSFSPIILIICWSGESIPSFISLFLFFIISIANYYRWNSIPLTWLCIIIVCIILIISLFSEFFIVSSLTLMM